MGTWQFQQKDERIHIFISWKPYAHVQKFIRYSATQENHMI